MRPDQAPGAPSGWRLGGCPAAPIRDVAKDTLVGEHLRHRKRTRRMVQAVLAAMMALDSRRFGRHLRRREPTGAGAAHTRIATSREVAALSGNLLARHLDLAELFAVEAYRLDPSRQALAGAVPGGHRQPAPGHLSACGWPGVGGRRAGPRPGHRGRTVGRHGAALSCPAPGRRSSPG